MTRHYFRPIKDETIVSVLHYLRSLIVRDGQDGLAHVDALLVLRGVEPATLPIPQKRPKAFRRGQLARLIMGALRDGPLTGAELARRVQGNGLEYAAAYKRVYQCLNRMQGGGVVTRERRLWRLADSANRKYSPVVQHVDG